MIRTDRNGHRWGAKREKDGKRRKETDVGRGEKERERQRYKAGESNVNKRDEGREDARDADAVIFSPSGRIVLDVSANVYQRDSTCFPLIVHEKALGSFVHRERRQIRQSWHTAVSISAIVSGSARDRPIFPVVIKARRDLPSCWTPDR